MPLDLLPKDSLLRFSRGNDISHQQRNINSFREGRQRALNSVVPRPLPNQPFVSWPSASQRRRRTARQPSFSSSPSPRVFSAIFPREAFTQIERASEGGRLQPPGRTMVASDTAGEKTDRLPKDARNILCNLASGWSDVADSRAMEVVQLKGAMTNQVYQINWLLPAGAAAREVGEPGSSPASGRKVLVRVYGEGVDVFFDRDDEIRTFECMSRHGQGPRLLGRFPNGRVEEFIHARTLAAFDLRDPEVSSLVAAKLKEFHALDMPGPKNVILWDRLRNWLKAARELASLEEAKEFRLDFMEEEISTIQNQMSGENQSIGFCHNDLQYGNIMMDEDTRLVTIIDYEYASYNPIAYDIANHFCEMAADYHTETPHVLDFDKYPDFVERRRFVLNYLTSSGDKPSDSEVQVLIQVIEKYTLASHLFWGLWGIISEHVNEIDFDYMDYARQRFQQYWLRKDAILGPPILSTEVVSSSDV